MYRVLIPVDDNEDRAHEQARFVSQLPNATETVEATVVHALHGEEREAARPTADRIGTVRHAVEVLEEAGVTVQTTDIGLPPDEGIIDWAEEMKADLIVMGGRKRSPAGKALFGSTTQSVILNTERPVAVVGGR